MANNNEVTTQELMEFLQENMATKEDLHAMEERMMSKEDGLKMMTKEDGLKMMTKEDGLKMEHRIVDSMDDKLAKLKGDLIVLMRKEDHKLIELIQILLDKKVLDPDETRKLLSLEPFPQSV
ncbi:MAG: hypothetical protein V1821_01085 [bacterium]